MAAILPELGKSVRTADNVLGIRIRGTASKQGKPNVCDMDSQGARYLEKLNTDVKRPSIDGVPLWARLGLFLTAGKQDGIRHTTAQNGLLQDLLKHPRVAEAMGPVPSSIPSGAFTFDKEVRDQINGVIHELEEKTPLASL